MADPSAVERLGTLVARTRFADLPVRAIERAKVSLVHNLAVALAGRSRETVAHRMAREFWPLPAQATLLFDGSRVPVEAASFANGALFHARSQDDTQAASTSHPGAPVMGAALAVAEFSGTRGDETLAAIVLGYEVLGLVGRDVDHLLTPRGWRPAALLGVFGAAAAAAKLLRLDAARTAHALALAAQMPAGTSQVWVEGSPDFPLQLGHAARNGVIAARAASLGATGARFALEGRSGFWRTYAGAEDVACAHFDAVRDAWQIEEATVKPHPVCAILQGPLECLLSLTAAHGLGARDVARVELALSPYEAAFPGIDNPGPIPNATAAKMSAQFGIGLALTAGRVTPEDLSRVGDADVRAFAGRIAVLADPGMPERLCQLTLHLADGRRIEGRVDAPVGQPGLDGIAAFARALAPEAGTTAARMEAVVAAGAALDAAPDLGALFAACGAC
jgi:2-methylcitrate dehydratase PrpD